jgi:TonB family protein
MKATKPIIRWVASGALAGTIFLMAAVLVGASQQQEQTGQTLKIVRRSEEALREIAIKRVDAVHPSEGKAAGIFGAVTVEVTIDESGDVVSARAHSGDPLLHNAAVKAARGWKFKPTTIQGEPVKLIGDITFYFTRGPTIEAAEMAVKEHPDSAQAYYDLSVVLAGNGRRWEAIEAVKDALRVDPNFQKGYVQLGGFLQAEGSDHEQEAINAFGQAIKLDPNDFGAKIGLASLYSRSKHFEEAVELYEEAIKEAPSLTLVYLSLGGDYAELGKYDEAEAAYKLVIEKRPGEVSAYIALGNLYMKVGRTTEGIAALKYAKTLSPRLLQAHFALGMAYAKSGDKKSALEEYEFLKKYMPGKAEELLKAIKE